jgi:transcriptional regulator with XRE-family HTH domain
VATIQELRLQRGWTQLELSRRARIHPSDLSKIEAGRIVPYEPQRRRLARALGVSVNQIMMKRQPVAVS